MNNKCHKLVPGIEVKHPIISNFLVYNYQNVVQGENYYLELLIYVMKHVNKQHHHGGQNFQHQNLHGRVQAVVRLSSIRTRSGKRRCGSRSGDSKSGSSASGGNNKGSGSCNSNSKGSSDKWWME